MKKQIKEGERKIAVWIAYQAIADIDDSIGAACALRDALQSAQVPDYLRGAARALVTVLINAQLDLAQAAEIEI